MKCWIRLGASLKLVQYSQNNSTPYSVLSAPMIQIIVSTRKFIQPWYNKVGQYLTTYQHYLSTYFLLTIDGTALYSYCIRAAAGALLQHVFAVSLLRYYWQIDPCTLRSGPYTLLIIFPWRWTAVTATHSTRHSAKSVRQKDFQAFCQSEIGFGVGTQNLLDHS